VRVRTIGEAMRLRGALGLIPAVLAISLSVDVAHAACPPTGCGVVEMPHTLTFTSPGIGLNDRNGVGTGFTMVDPPSRGTGYLPGLLTVDQVAGTLGMDTTAGIAYRTLNSLDNALGVGVVPRGSPFLLWATLRVPAASDGYAQAGLWFGTSEDDYVKLVVIASGGTRVQMLRESVPESARAPIAYNDPRELPAGSSVVSLRLQVDPATHTVTGAYAVDGGKVRQIRKLDVLDSLLYRDGQGDSAVATGGVFATRRLATTPMHYVFEDFVARCVTEPCTPGPAPENPDIGDGEPPVGVPTDETPPDDTPSSGPAAGGGSAGGAGPGGGTATPPANDPTSERATLTAPRRIRATALMRRGLRGALSCSRRCSYVATLTVSGRDAGRLALAARRSARVAIARRRSGEIEADRTAQLILRPTARTLRTLAGRRTAGLRLRLTVRVLLASGETQSLQRTVIVRR
jgi:hypothetical protein